MVDLPLPERPVYQSTRGFCPFNIARLALFTCNQNPEGKAQTAVWAKGAG
jgi:hypothetical protein